MPLRPPIRVHVATPDIVKQGKDLKTKHINCGIMQEYEERPYYCRSCGTCVSSKSVPEGWYSLGRHLVEEARGPRVQRIGLFCSIRCLIAQIPRIDGVDQHLGEDWKRITETYRG